MTTENASLRLLPWSSPDGKPCFLSGDGTGYVSRLADSVECIQLGMAGDLLDHAAALLGDGRATPDQLRFLLRQMSEALGDVHRIAESRGARLPVPYEYGDPEYVDPNETDAGGSVDA